LEEDEFRVQLLDLQFNQLRANFRFFVQKITLSALLWDETEDEKLGLGVVRYFFVGVSGTVSISLIDSVRSFFFSFL
jgi:hypothetical protein